MSAQGFGKCMPDKGKIRYFGSYECPFCQRHWMSNNSFPNEPQVCWSCGARVNAKYQHPLRKHHKMEPKSNQNERTVPPFRRKADYIDQSSCIRCTIL